MRTLPGFLPGFLLVAALPALLALPAAAAEEPEPDPDPAETLYVLAPTLQVPPGDPLERVPDMLDDTFANGMFGTCATFLSQQAALDIVHMAGVEQTLGVETRAMESLAEQIGRVSLLAHASVGRIGETYVAHCALVDTLEMRVLARREVRGDARPESVLEALEGCAKALKPAVRCGLWQGSVTVTVTAGLTSKPGGGDSASQSESQDCSATWTIRGREVRVAGRFATHGDYFAPADDKTGVASDVRGNSSGQGNSQRTLDGGLTTYTDGTYLLALDGVGVEGTGQATVCDGEKGACSRQQGKQNCYVPGVNISGVLEGSRISGEQQLEEWETEGARYSAKAQWSLQRTGR